MPLQAIGASIDTHFRQSGWIRT